MANRIKKLLKNIFLNSRDRYYSIQAHNVEVKKIKDPRRVEIANQFPLSKEQKEQVDNLFVNNYGEQVDYVWHQYYAAHANRFDYRFIPELLFIPEFERFQNLNKAANRLLSDKNFLPIVANTAGVRMPQTIVSCTNGVFRDGDNHIVPLSVCKGLLNKYPYFFIKPTKGSCSGQSCLLKTETDKYDFINNTLIISGFNGEVGYSQDFVCQEIIKTHESVSVLHPESVNTFRIITYLWRGHIESMPIIMRIGRGKSIVDNAHAGGMFIAVQPNGALGDHAVTEFNNQYFEHPDSGVVFKNHKIAFCDKMIAAAKRMHELVPQVGVINWDFTVSDDGEPVLIEANIGGGSIWLPQMAHGIGVFEEKTAEVLQWLEFMKKLNTTDRYRFVGGKMA